MKDLANKTVLITGAASGIGRATAAAFAREEAGPLILGDIDSGGLAETARELEGLGCDPVLYPVDVSDSDMVEKMIGEVLDRFGGIDVLVNVAGVSLICPAEKLDLDDWRKVVDVDLWGIIHTVHAVYPHMVERRSGHIVNIASTDGLFVPGLYFSAPYCTSKFGVVGLSESLLYEGLLHNIGVTCVCPGAVETPIFDTTPVKGLRPEIKELERYISYSKEAPEETARVIVEAVRRNRFLVVTTRPMKISYFVRRHLPFLWFPLMKAFTRVFRRLVDKYRI